MNRKKLLCPESAEKYLKVIVFEEAVSWYAVIKMTIYFYCLVYFF